MAKGLSPARLELLGAILKLRPESIYALAKALGRDFKNVHSDVKMLAEVGLLELKATGKREAVDIETGSEWLERVGARAESSM